MEVNSLRRRSPVGRAPAHERGARIKIPTMMPDALDQFKATQPVVASPACNGCLEVLQYRWAVPRRKLNQSSRSSSGLQTSIQSAPALTAWMVAQARKPQDAVQRRLPDVRIVLQEGRAWQTDGLLEVCEHRGAIQATDLSAPPHGLCKVLWITPRPSPERRAKWQRSPTRCGIILSGLVWARSSSKRKVSTFPQVNLVLNQPLTCDVRPAEESDRKGAGP
jgi:hypothetical protein